MEQKKKEMCDMWIISDLRNAPMLTLSFGQERMSIKKLIF